MRCVMIAASLLLAMNLHAQLDDNYVEGMPTIAITQRSCIAEEDGGEMVSSRKAPLLSATQKQACLSAMGSPKILVCLAEFTDVKFTVGEDAMAVQEVFESFFNGNGIGAGDNPYSVCDYFKAMSGGLFSPEFVIMDVVTVQHGRRYYGDVSGIGRRTVFRNDALTQLAPQIHGRMDEFDTNADGKIDGVVIVFPGCGANVGDREGMHPACWTAPSTIAGITYATELVAPELLGMDDSDKGGENNAKLNGIGVYVHEMSHMLGLPDFYDLNYKAAGMDYWSLMDYGEYWHNGYRPTPYTAYERNFMGWMPLVELSEPVYIPSMRALDDGGSAYIIYNDGNRDEYYILENRNAGDEWSASLCTSLGNGLMVYHVDYDAAAWSNNQVNTDAGRQRMTIIPANGHFELCDNLIDDADRYISELKGHLWPLSDDPAAVSYWGIAGNNGLTDVERTEGGRIAPAATLHSPNTDGTYLMHKPITEISYDNSALTVSFSFMGGKSETGIPDMEEGTGSMGDAFVRVYTVDGRMVANCRESQLCTMPAGVYILRDTVTGKTSKRFIGR